MYNIEKISDESLCKLNDCFIDQDEFTDFGKELGKTFEYISRMSFIGMMYDEFSDQSKILGIKQLVCFSGFLAKNVEIIRSLIKSVDLEEFIKAVEEE